ncbi:glycosyltransferase family 39 protein [Candidatus Microgenomates bacterium]|nr:glycosyltransferase family 39 protein [Candidatus Microgenomates bacterium]
MKKTTWFYVTALALISFLFRLWGIRGNHPFWVDEFSTAAQANYYLKYGLGVFTNHAINLEGNNYTFHTLIALSFRLFGTHEFAARLPAVIAGSLVPVALFFLAKKLFGIRTALVASLLTTFSYFQIVWSDQARSYSLLQLLTITTLYFYAQIIDHKSRTSRNILLFIISILLGWFTHAQFIILLIALVGHFVLMRTASSLTYVKRRPIISIVAFVIVGLFMAHMSRQGAISPTGINNLWYYHSFLWREYGMITFVAILGILAAFVSRRSNALLVLTYLAVHFAFFSFGFRPYVSRYLLPIFPLFFMMFGYAITYGTELICDQQKIKDGTIFNKFNLKLVIPLLLALFIIGNGYKFVFKPKPYYSINHDFREIANIDYNRVYDLIKQKGHISEGKTAVIDTWHDRLHWYLGEDYKAAYIFRWINDSGSINGLTKTTNVVVARSGEKYLDRVSNVRVIGDITDLNRAMKQYPRGFLFIDDSSLPADVIHYAETQMKKELFLDRYPLDDNPYSVWPATLYSWGL